MLYKDVFPIMMQLRFVDRSSFDEYVKSILLPAADPTYTLDDKGIADNAESSIVITYYL